MPYAELAAKTNYSFLEGASHPEEMIERAAHLDYQAIAITDHEGVYAIPRAHKIAKALSLPLIIGSELSLGKSKEAPKKEPVLLLAINRNGYGNLCEWISKGGTWESIDSYHEDLIALVRPWQMPLKKILKLNTYFNKRLYLIVSRFYDGKERYLLELATHYSKRYGMPCLASNEPLFHLPNRKPLQDILTAIRTHQPITQCGFDLLPNAERYLKPKEEIETLFQDHPEWLENTLEIVHRCQFSLDEIRYQYPNEWIPKGQTAESYLTHLVWDGVKRCYPHQCPPKVIAQIKSELKLIAELQYADYFLTTWDIVQFAKSQNILCQGRGSAANSIICYVLGITAIDPVRMNLLFERFISRERKEPPDIDIDFEHERREEVIQYIYKHYGRERAAITAEIVCYRRRSALREVGKAFKIPESTVKEFITLSHKRSLTDISPEEMQDCAPEIPAKTIQMYLHFAKNLLGFPRHLGTHVGGFVLCQDPLNRNVPIEKAAMPGRTIIQWDKNDLDSLNFIKIDVLGLGILTAIQKSFCYLKETYAVTLDLSTIPPEDPKVYAQIQQADTIGIFQIESRAQMNMLPRLRPKNFFDIVVEISLVRPGPIQGEMVHPYLKRRHGKEPIHYAHPELKAILKKTCGIPLFQEQVMEIAIKVAGFSAGEADQLRRLMGTWRREGKNRLTQMGEKFRKGLIRKGIAKPFADRIFKQIEGFAEYGFPESHAASFAILAYATAYLKCYYPDVFVCALLNSQPMGFYSNHTLIHDAQRHQVQILNVDINHSCWDNTLAKKGTVRLGFREIKSLSKRTALHIEQENRKQRFESFFDFIERMKNALSPAPLTKRELFCLAASNAFQSLQISRREAFWEIQGLKLKEALQDPDEKVSLPKENAWEKITLDYEALGISLYAHPMQCFRKKLEKLGTLPSQAIKDPRWRKKRIQTAGIVISRQMPPTASGVLFITLEDEFGFSNLVIWNAVYQKYRKLLLTHSLLLCQGTIEKAEDGNVYHVIAEHFAPLLNHPDNFDEIPSYDFH